MTPIGLAYKYPKKNLVEVNRELLDQRALALTMAVITQVHVSATQFEVAKRKLGTSMKFNNVNNNILEQTMAGHRTRKVSDQTLVRERMNQLVSEARYDICLLYTSPSPRDRQKSRMPSSG